MSTAGFKMDANATGARKDLEKLVVVAGHAVYVGTAQSVAANDASWALKSFQKGEPRCYIEHIRFGVDLAASQPKSLLVFSGGQTMSEAGSKSEAQGYWEVADQFSWWNRIGVRNRATTEEFARDSFENLLFGIARFRECTGHYPKSLEIVGWEFKRERFNFHRQTIRWPEAARHYAYHGVNNPEDLAGSLRSEARTFAAFIRDPFGTEENLLAKRTRRNPFGRQAPYAENCPEMAGLLSHRTADGRVFTGALPWEAGPPEKGELDNPD